MGSDVLTWLRFVCMERCVWPNVFIIAVNMTEVISLSGLGRSGYNRVTGAL